MCVCVCPAYAILTLPCFSQLLPRALLLPPDIYCGYVDDPRNTDNAWIETVAIHYHCNADQATELELRAGEDVTKAAWLDVDPVHESRYAQLYASHRSIVDRVAR